jgi:sugar/nucleoside kinase (ribokinase family)
MRETVSTFLVDDIVRPGQTISSIRFERRAGGKGANQAAAVARAGGAVSLVGAVGEDGAWLVRNLEGYGVSAANVTTVQVQYPSLDISRPDWAQPCPVLSRNDPALTRIPLT